jgi:isohexenylglutaconyl-CoA hydratase
VDSLLRVQQTGPRLTLTLDDARRQNALSVEMIESIDHALEGAPHDLAALVIQGANGVFSAGADLKSLAEALAKPLACGETDALQTLNAAGGRFFARFAALPFMTIAVVDGAAVGGGMGLAAASDVVIATPRARFALTETSLGIPPAQIAPYLAHRLGEHVARRLAMTGARIEGREAETLGLADFYCGSDAERDAKLEALLQSVEHCASCANAETKRLFSLTRSTTPEAYIDAAAKSFAEALRGPEGREGIAAFLAKRAPTWRRL